MIHVIHDHRRAGLELWPWQQAFLEEWERRRTYRVLILGRPVRVDAWGECAWTARDLFEGKRDARPVPSVPLG